ncbi:MAG: YihY/virulence factor BrkB family protein [Bacteroidia bacterium]|nr:YihY/virulence factor BrkB family protein [Bacteroidia bacterium]
MNRLRQFLIVRRLELWLHRLKLPGFRGIGLLSVLRFFIHEISDKSLMIRASAMAFDFFFALFPTLLFAFFLIPYFGIPNLEQEAEKFLLAFFPDASGFEIIKQIINSSFEKRGIGLLAINIFLTIYSATRGIITLIHSFNKSDSFFYERSWLQERWVSFQILFVLLGLLFFGIGLLIYGDILLNQLHEWQIVSSTLLYYGLHFLNWLIYLILILIGVSYLFYKAPARHRKWAFFTPGAFLAALLCVLATLGLRFFVANFNTYNTLYGSLAAIMLLMIWFQWIAIVLLIGFELNVSIDRAEKKPLQTREFFEDDSLL